MGLTNAEPTFQHLMDSIFRDLDFVLCYLDDILIVSRSEEEHLCHLKIVLDQLQEHQLIDQVSMLAFVLEEIQLFGVLFLAQGRAVDPEKTAAIHQMSPQSTMNWLQQCNSKLSPTVTLLPISKPTLASAMCRTSDGRLGHTRQMGGRRGGLGGGGGSVATSILLLGLAFSFDH